LDLNLYPPPAFRYGIYILYGYRLVMIKKLTKNLCYLYEFEFILTWTLFASSCDKDCCNYWRFFSLAHLTGCHFLWLFVIVFALIVIRRFPCLYLHIYNVICMSSQQKRSNTKVCDKDLWLVGFKSSNFKDFVNTSMPCTLQSIL